jgi:coproporphyrinogen III oxidase
MSALSRRSLMTTALAASAAPLQAAEPAKVQPGDDMAGLKPAEQALAKKHLAFIEKTKKDYFARIDKLNGAGNNIQTADVRTDSGIYPIQLARGPVVEKAGFFQALVTAEMPPFLTAPKWNRYLEIDVHAKNAKTPFLHLTMTFQFMADGSSNTGGWMDVLEGPKNPAEIDAIRARMDATMRKHGEDPKPYRDRILRKREDNPYRRHPAGAGFTLLPPPEREITEKTQAMLQDAFTTMLDAYLDLLEKQKDLPVTAEDIAAQEAMRKNWLEDQLFSDPFSGKLVPYSVWGLGNAPPTVKL